MSRAKTTTDEETTDTETVETVTAETTDTVEDSASSSETVSSETTETDSAGTESTEKTTVETETTTETVKTTEKKYGIVRYFQMYPMENKTLERTIKKMYGREAHTITEWKQVIEDFLNQKV